MARCAMHMAWLLLVGAVLRFHSTHAFFQQRQRVTSSSLFQPNTYIQSTMAATEALNSKEVNNGVETTLEERAKYFLQTFEAAWKSDNDADALASFVDDTASITPFWRDMVAFTWNICTMEGPVSIQEALQSTNRAGASFEFSSHPMPIASLPDNGLEFWCDLSIESVGTGKAHFRLDGQDRIQTLLTTLMDLEDRPFRVGHNRARGQIHGPTPNRMYWQERMDASRSEDPFCLIIGAGQAGLGLGARLQLLDIPYTILEAGESPGVAWRRRYPSLHLHDPVWYNHMPYLPFPESWPVLCPRDKVADWMESYAKIMDLNVKCKSRVQRVEQLEDGSWQATIQEGEHTRTCRAQHVIFCTGNSSHPRIPKIPGKFGGIQLHSSRYSSGGRPYAGKRVVVIGSNNSGFDVSQDLWEQGAASVTMIQRSPSLVVSTQSVLKHGLGHLYRQDAPLHHEDADLVATTMPYKLLLPRWKQVNDIMKETDKELHEGIVKAGYKLDFGPDGTGLFSKSATEGGGFYINMGCAELITNGDIAIRYATVQRLEDDAVIIEDKESGVEDVIIYATGFDTMDQWVADLCGDDVARSVGRSWGLGLGKRPKDPGPWEGELRNMWKPTTIDGLWFHGGNLAQSRHYSRFLSLQLAARYMGLDTSVYGIPVPTPPQTTN